MKNRGTGETSGLCFALGPVCLLVASGCELFHKPLGLLPNKMRLDQKSVAVIIDPPDRP